MDTLLLAGALLACPIAMGAMMFMMMREQHGNDSAEPNETRRLEAEIADLKAAPTKRPSNGAA